MAVRPGAHVVVLGAPAPPADDAVAGLEHALGGAGVAVVARTVADVDDDALATVLSAGPRLTVVLAPPASHDVVRRAIAAAMAEVADTRSWSPGAWAVVSPERSVVVLPRGVWLDPLVREHLLPFLASRRPGGTARTLKIVGPSLAEVEERLRSQTLPAGVEAHLLPAEAETWVRLLAPPGSSATAADLAAAETALASALGADCYGRDADTLEQVVGRLLLDRALTVSVAESCTGGLLGHRLTGVPGSSAWFERGVLVYSNRAKQELLAVPAGVLRDHGAVSGPCAEAMARGMAAAGGTPCALAITGIAGPDGGTPTKPVGTVFIGLAFRGDVASRHFVFAGDRASVKWQSAQQALDMLRRRLMDA